jgi:hypothetical protein
MKKTLTPLFLLVVLMACSTGSQQPVATTAPGHGAVTIRIEPNPIVARAVSGDTYDFPFEVIVRETGGRAIQIHTVTATVRGPGGFALATEIWDAARIRALGYSTTIGPNGELRYRFSPRESVPDERLFGSVTAELRVDATDETSKGTTASTDVSITR